MSAMASQITSLTIVYSAVYSRRRSKKTSNLRVTVLCEGNSPVTGEFPAQRASNPENVSIWWRRHILFKRNDVQWNRKMIWQQAIISRTSWRSKCSINNIPELFQIMFWHWPGDKYIYTYINVCVCNFCQTPRVFSKIQRAFHISPMMAGYGVYGVTLSCLWQPMLYLNFALIGRLKRGFNALFLERNSLCLNDWLRYL